MAKQNGIIRIKGKIGGMSFYESNGTDFVRENTSLSKEQIMKDPAFQRTRENMVEFAGAATAGKSLRLALAGVLRSMTGRNTVGRITQLMKKVNTFGTGIRGQRDFDFGINAQLLQGFEFVKITPLTSVFSAPFTYSSTAARNEATLIVPDFHTGNFITAPDGATHFRFVNAIGVLSNFWFNTTSSKYEPADPVLNGVGEVGYSPYIPLGGMVGSTTTVQTILPSQPAMSNVVSLVGCVGIEFYQEVNLQHYLLGAGNAMRIERLF